MPLPLSASERRVVVQRLRAAGCVFAEAEADVLLDMAAGTADLEAGIARRVAGEPLEQVVGWAEFCGLRVSVAPGVFVPRRRTEFLVEQAIDAASPGDLVLDLCCGTGAIGLAIAAGLPSIELHAAELDPVAAACARRNLGDVPVFTGDLFDAVPTRYRGQYAVVAANVPYVPTAAIATLPLEARRHEPATALDGGDDGLDVLRRVATGAPHWVRPGGVLLIEISEHQAAAALVAFDAAGLDPHLRSNSDLSASVVVGVAREG